jgi:ADP-heptose:LPS heptosyltransferase
MVLVNIFSSKESKNIPYTTAVSIIKHLKEKAIEPVVISSPSNEGVNKRLSEEAGAEMLVTHSIFDACRHIHLAKALISADTSLVHLAGTYNTPVLVISRAIEEELKKFAPKSDINIVVESESKQTIVVSEEQVKKSIDKLIETIR